jgi:hypothetical protein
MDHYMVKKDIDTDLCIKGKMYFDVCGHDSINDSFQLINLLVYFKYLLIITNSRNTFYFQLK